MAIDTSIYNNIQPVQMPSYLDSMQKASTLSQLAMQQQQMGLQMQTQRAMRDAYAKNTDPSGNLDQKGFLSDLAKVNPQASLQYQEQLGKSGQASADAQKSQADAFQKKASIAANAINYVAKLPPELQEKGYNDIVGHLVGSGVASPTQFPPFSKDALNDLAVKSQQFMGQNSADFLGNEKTKAEIGKTISETGEKAVNRLTDYQKMLTGNDDYKKQVGTLSSGKNVLAVIDDAQKNPGSASQLEMELARFANDGQRVPPEQLQSFMKHLPLGDRITEVISQARHGTITPDSADFLKQFITTKMGSAAQNKSDIEMDHAKKFSMATGLPVEAAYSQLTAQAPGTIANVPAGPAKFANGQNPSSGGGLFGNTAIAANVPKPGDVRKGFVFNGGDPSDKNNWKRQR